MSNHRNLATLPDAVNVTTIGQPDDTYPDRCSLLKERITAAAKETGFQTVSGAWFSSPYAGFLNAVNEAPTGTREAHVFLLDGDMYVGSHEEKSKIAQLVTARPEVLLGIGVILPEGTDYNSEDYVETMSWLEELGKLGQVFVVDSNMDSDQIAAKFAAGVEDREERLRLLDATNS